MYFQEPNFLPSQISLPSSRRVRNHGKKNLLPKKIKEDQANKNSEERSYVVHPNKLGFRDIDVPRGRHTTLKFFLKMMKRRRRRKKKQLHRKRKCMKQHNKKIPLPIYEK